MPPALPHPFTVSAPLATSTTLRWERSAEAALLSPARPIWTNRSEAKIDDSERHS